MEERQKRIGPGGLDPVEVFESLPEELKKCFESQDIQLLQETIMKMKKEDAEYHMDRCVKSGLWVPDANAKKEGKVDESGLTSLEEAAAGKVSAEEVYDEIKPQEEKK